MAYSAEDKKAYYKNLREQWSAAKKTADTDHIAAIIRNHGLNISVTGFAFVQAQMDAQGLEGLPYLDMKTFHGWKENGFKVQKGQHSTATGLTWVAVGKPKEERTETDPEPFKMPRSYSLFHRSQVANI